MSKEDNKHPDIERIKKAISRWKAQEKAKEKTKAEQKRLAEEEAERQRQVELQRQRDKNLSETGYSETDAERSYREHKEDKEENARVQANVDKIHLYLWKKHKKEYSKLFNLVFPSHKINTDKVSYHLFDDINWNFETKEKNGQYIAIKPCPEFCISSEENPKFLYNTIGIKPSTIYAKKNLEEYRCPYGVGYHLRSKSLNRKNL
tara:strand:+ start:425 stop:1039 length:615 start_codon:yes stop_codon:yes gene_type:complete